MKLVRVFMRDAEGSISTRGFYLSDGASVSGLVTVVRGITEAAVFKVEAYESVDDTTVVSTEHSDVENKGTFVFGTSGNSVTQVTIPAIKKAFLDPASDNIIRTLADVLLIIDFMLNNGRSKYGQAVSHLIQAKEAYSKRRNS